MQIDVAGTGGKGCGDMNGGNMTGRKGREGKKLAREILEYLGVSLLLSAFIFCFLFFTSDSVAEIYLMNRGMVLTQVQAAVLTAWLRSICLAASTAIFVVLFLSLLSGRISYLLRITEAVRALDVKQMEDAVPIEGEDELAELADTIRLVFASKRELEQKEQELRMEREEWIRSLSHDIRTPLTSILSYSELLQNKEGLKKEEMDAYLSLVKGKAEQIRDLTDQLLGQETGKREHVENVRFLMEQMAEEWEELLEESFICQVDLSQCQAEAGSLNIQDLRRIFDNLISNVERYADPAEPVFLQITAKNGVLTLMQKNKIKEEMDGNAADSHKLGLQGIRRMTERHGGDLEIQNQEGGFQIQIQISFSEIPL